MINENECYFQIYNKNMPYDKQDTGGEYISHVNMKIRNIGKLPALICPLLKYKLAENWVIIYVPSDQS